MASTGLVRPNEENLALLCRWNVYQSYFDGRVSFSIPPPYLGGANFEATDNSDLTGLHPVLLLPERIRWTSRRPALAAQHPGFSHEWSCVCLCRLHAYPVER